MTSWHFVLFLSVLARLTPSIVGIRYWRRYERGEKAFIILLFYDIFGMIIGAFLVYYYHNNIVMSHIYSIMEVGLLSVYYKTYISSKSAKQIISWFPFIFTAFTIIMVAGFTGVFNNNPSESAIRALFSIVFGSIALSQIVTEYENVTKQGHFWIISGLLFYYLINIGYLTMSYWLIKTDSTLTMGLHAVLTYSFYVVNMLYAWGLWLIAKERKRNIITEEIASTSSTL